jgi:hypothetical protein
MKTLIAGKTENYGIFLHNDIYIVVGGYHSKEFKTLNGAKKYALKYNIIQGV